MDISPSGADLGTAITRSTWLTAYCCTAEQVPISHAPTRSQAWQCNVLLSPTYSNIASIGSKVTNRWTTEYTGNRLVELSMWVPREARWREPRSGRLGAKASRSPRWRVEHATVDGVSKDRYFYDPVLSARLHPGRCLAAGGDPRQAGNHPGLLGC